MSPSMRMSYTKYERWVPICKGSDEPFAAVLKIWQMMNQFFIVWNVICTTTNTDSGVIIASGMQASGVVLRYFPFRTSISSLSPADMFPLQHKNIFYIYILDHVQLKFMLKMLMTEDKAAEAHVKYLLRWLGSSEYTVYSPRRWYPGLCVDKQMK